MQPADPVYTLTKIKLLYSLSYFVQFVPQHQSKFAFFIICTVGTNSYLKILFFLPVIYYPQCSVAFLMRLNITKDAGTCVAVPLDTQMSSVEA